MASQKEKIALTSIAASAALTVAKAAVGFATGSLAILSEAAHSLSDVAATVLTYFAVRVSDKPADEEHPYGHGKIESVTALAETALLFALAGVVMWEAARRLIGLESHSVEATIWAFAVIVVSIVVDFFRARVLNRVASETSSHALEADALHFSSDMWSSLAVLLGLVGVAFGIPWADPAAALVVSIFIGIAGWRLGRRTVEALVDTAPSGVAEQVQAAIRKVRGVVHVERVRVRPVGPRYFVDVAISVPRTYPVDRVTSVKNDVQAAVTSILHDVDLTVTTTPTALDDETVQERVMVIARNRGLAIHHLTVQALADRLAVAVDIEVDGSLTLARAHEIASDLEAAIHDELGPPLEVETHIEPLQSPELSGRDATPERVGLVRDALVLLAVELGTIGDVHNVRVRETDAGEIVNFHCRVEPGRTVHDVHEMVDEVERALRRRMPSIKRVIGHAEPARAKASVTA